MTTQEPVSFGQVNRTYQESNDNKNCYQQKTIRKNVEDWPQGLIRKMRRIRHSKIEDISKNVRTTLILRSMNDKIPRKLLE